MNIKFCIYFVLVQQNYIKVEFTFENTIWKKKFSLWTKNIAVFVFIGINEKNSKARIMFFFIFWCLFHLTIASQNSTFIPCHDNLI